MKIQHNLFPCLAITFIIIVSCSKSDSVPITNRPNNPPPPYMLEREYFWVQSWQKTSTGYEIKLQTQRLTDSAINKGIRVGLAIYSDWSVYETLPFTVNDPSWLTDTINLTYSALPGKLQVFAKTAVNITWPSDIFIQYE